MNSVSFILFTAETQRPQSFFEEIFSLRALRLCGEL
jgi:hypothetical protein